MPNENIPMWKELGIDLEKHDMLLNALGPAFQEIYLSQKNRPAGMGFYDFVVGDIHGIRVKELKEHAFNGGKVVATYELHAAGPAAKNALAVDPGDAKLPHDYDDVSTLQVTITDAAGNPVASATPQVQFAITGPGAIAAIDNGAADNHESFQGNQVRAAGGQCTAYIRSTADSGTITVTATADGLVSGTVVLVAQPRNNR